MRAMTKKMTRRFAWVLGGLLLAAQLPAHATVEYIHTDSLGTPVAITDSDGNVIQTSEYEPFGKLLNRPLTDAPGYTGHETDATTGMVYAQQRYYDPQIGRFLSADPVTPNSGGGFNRYEYAIDNPYRFTDPDGRQSQSQPNQEEATREQELQKKFSGGQGFTGTSGGAQLFTRVDGDIAGSHPHMEGKIEHGPTSISAATKEQPSYWQRVKNNFADTNKAVPGLMAPPLTGILTGRALSNATKLPTLLDAAVGSYRAGYLTLELAPALVHSGFNFVLAGVSFETGNLAGSLINAAQVPGSGGITYREWYTDKMCSTSGKC